MRGSHKSHSPYWEQVNGSNYASTHTVPQPKDGAISYPVTPGCASGYLKPWFPMVINDPELLGLWPRAPSHWNWNRVTSNPQGHFSPILSIEMALPRLFIYPTLPSPLQCCQAPLPTHCKRGCWDKGTPPAMWISPFQGGSRKVPNHEELAKPFLTFCCSSGPRAWKPIRATWEAPPPSKI